MGNGIKKIFIDMDGVTVDLYQGIARTFDRSLDTLYRNWKPGNYAIEDELGLDGADALWAKIDPLGENWWRHLNEYPWFNEIIHLVWGYAPFMVATSPSRAASSAHGKLLWLQDRFGSKFRDYALVHEKHNLAGPGRILIDDYDKNIDAWVAHGGLAITFPRLWNREHAKAADPMAHVRAELNTMKRLLS